MFTEFIRFQEVRFSVAAFDMRSSLILSCFLLPRLVSVSWAGSMSPLLAHSTENF